MIKIELERPSQEQLQRAMQATIDKYPPNQFGTLFHTPVPHLNGTWSVTGERYRG